MLEGCFQNTDGKCHEMEMEDNDHNDDLHKAEGVAEGCDDGDGDDGDDGKEESNRYSYVVMTRMTGNR